MSRAKKTMYLCFVVCCYFPLSFFSQFIHSLCACLILIFRFHSAAPEWLIYYSFGAANSFQLNVHHDGRFFFVCLSCWSWCTYHSNTIWNKFTNFISCLKIRHPPLFRCYHHEVWKYLFVAVAVVVLVPVSFFIEFLFQWKTFKYNNAFSHCERQLHAKSVTKEVEQIKWQKKMRKIIHKRITAARTLNFRFMLHRFFHKFHGYVCILYIYVQFAGLNLWNKMQSFEFYDSLPHHND